MFLHFYKLGQKDDDFLEDNKNFQSGSWFSKNNTSPVTYNSFLIVKQVFLCARGRDSLINHFVITYVITHRLQRQLPMFTLVSLEELHKRR
jgi:hypothetical protein